nr:hypothetical protein 19 [Burkholderiaceae bacterium]
MNYLQLVNRARTECGVSGNNLTTTVNQTGENSRFTSWVSTAYVDIQTAREDWNFLRGNFAFNTVAQQGNYTATDAGIASDFGNWKRDSFRCSKDSNFVDEQLMAYMNFTEFRNLYRYGNMRTTFNRPVVVAFEPDKGLAFGPIPDIVYHINGEYYKKPIEFTSDDQEPRIPDQYHMLIVYKAMQYYGGYESAPEVFSRGEFEFRRLMERLHIDQLPTTISGPPLA